MKTYVHPIAIKNYILSVFKDYELIPKLNSLIEDIILLYEGKWPEFERCEAPYHNLRHAFNVAELTAIIIEGWNKSFPFNKLSSQNK